MKQFKKFVSLSLALLLVISFFPNYALADGEDNGKGLIEVSTEIVESTETVQDTEEAADTEESEESAELEESPELTQDESQVEDTSEEGTDNVETEQDEAQAEDASEVSVDNTQDEAQAEESVDNEQAEESNEESVDNEQAEESNEESVDSEQTEESNDQSVEEEKVEEATDDTSQDEESSEENTQDLSSEEEQKIDEQSEAKSDEDSKEVQEKTRKSVNSSTVTPENVDEYLIFTLNTDEEVFLNEEGNGYNDYVLDVDLDIKNAQEFFDDDLNPNPDFEYVDDLKVEIELPESGLLLGYGEEKSQSIPWVGSFEEKREWDVDIDVTKVESEFSYDVVVYIGDGDPFTNDEKVEIKRFTRTIKVPAVLKKRGIVLLHGITGGEIFIRQNANSSTALANMTEDFSYSENRPYKIGDTLYVSEAANVDSYFGMFMSLFAAEYIKTDILMAQCDRYGVPIVLSSGGDIEGDGHYGPIGVYNAIMQNLTDNFKEEYGVRNIDFFGYDWRLSSSESADDLENMIEDEGYDEVVLISHSMGGIVVSAFLEKEENREKVDKYISLGSPFLGAPKVAMILGTGRGMTGYDLADQAVGDLIKYLAMNFKSAFELLPSERYFVLNKSHYLNRIEESNTDTRFVYETFDESSDLINELFDKDGDRTFVEDAKTFQEGLFVDGEHITSLVNTYYVTGYGYDTIADIDVDFTADGDFYWMNEANYTNIEGDGTVPLISALIGGRTGYAKSYFVNQEHLGLVSDENVFALINSIINSENDEAIEYPAAITEDLLSVLGDRPLTPAEDGITYEELANGGIDFSQEDKLEVSYEVSGLEDTSLAVYDSEKVEIESTATKPEVVEVDGYDFVMFTADGENEFNFEETVIIEDIVITAVYKKIVNEEIEELDAQPVTTFVTVILDEETQADFDALDSYGFKWMHVAFKESIAGLGYYEMGMNYDILNSHKLKAGNVASVDLGKGYWNGAQIVVPVEGNKEFNPIKMSIKKVRRGYWFPTTYRTLLLEVSKRFDVRLELFNEENYVNEDVLVKVIDNENNYFLDGLKAIYLDNADTPLSEDDYMIVDNLIVLRSNLFTEIGTHKIEVLSRYYDARTLEFEVKRELENFEIVTGENYVGEAVTFTFEGSEGDFLSNLESVSLGDDSPLASELYSTNDDNTSITLAASLFEEAGEKTVKFKATYYPEQSKTFEVKALKDVKLTKLESKNWGYDYYELSFDDDDYAGLVNYLKAGEVEYVKGFLISDNRYNVYSTTLIDMRLAGFDISDVTDTNIPVLMKAPHYNDLEFIVDRHGKLVKGSELLGDPQGLKLETNEDGEVIVGNNAVINLDEESATQSYLHNVHKLVLLSGDDREETEISTINYSLSDSQLEVDYSVFNGVGDYTLVIYSNEYNPYSLDIKYAEQAQLLSPPVLNLISDELEVGDTVIYSGDAVAYYNEISSILVNESPDLFTYTTEASSGMLRLRPAQDNLEVGEYTVRILANGYEDLILKFTYNEKVILDPPAITSFEKSYSWAGWSKYYHYNFKFEDTAYMSKIKAVKVNDTVYENHLLSSYDNAFNYAPFYGTFYISYNYGFIDGQANRVVISTPGYKDLVLDIVDNADGTSSYTIIEEEPETAEDDTTADDNTSDDTEEVDVVDDDTPADTLDDEDGSDDTEDTDVDENTDTTDGTDVEENTDTTDGTDVDENTDTTDDTDVEEETDNNDVIEDTEATTLNPFRMEKYEVKSGTLSYYCRLSFEHDPESQADDLANYLSNIETFELNGTVYSKSFWGNLNSENSYTVSEGKYIDFSVENVNFDVSNLLMIESEGYKNNYIVLNPKDGETLKVLPKVKSVAVRLIPTMMNPGYARLEFEGDPDQIAQFIYNIESVNVNGYEYNKYPVVGSGILFKLLELSEDIGLRDVAVKFGKYIIENMGGNPLAADALGIINDNVGDLSEAIGGFVADHSWFGAEREQVQNADGEWIDNETTVTEILDLKTALLPSPLGSWAYVDFSSESIDFFGPTNIVIKSEGFEDLSVDFTVVSTILDQGGVKPALELKSASFNERYWLPDYCRLSFNGESNMDVNNYLLSIRSVKVGETEHYKHSSLLWNNSFMVSKVYGDIFGRFAFLDLTTGAFIEEGSTNVVISANGYRDLRFALDKEGNISEYLEEVPEEGVELKILEVKEGDNVVQSAPETE